MDQLALHIEYLLRRNDCVILPGVGAFISVHIPARYDKQTATWHPMTQEIRFNQAVNQDDGLLANSYARKYTLPFHEARMLLDSDIRAMLSLIEHDGEVSLGRIGMLKAGEGNSLVFTPLYSHGYSNKEIGLIPVNILQNHAPVANETSEHEVHENNDNIHCEEESSEAGRKFDTVRNYYIAINKTFAKVACSLVAICVVALFVIFNTDNRTGEDKASVLPVKEIVDTTASLAKGKLQSASSSVEGNQKKDEESTNIKNSSENSADSSASASDKKRFHLIVGTFRSENDAMLYIESNASSAKDFKIIPSKTLWRVSMASSDDKSELINRLNSREVSEKYDGAWIYEEKNAL